MPYFLQDNDIIEVSAICSMQDQAAFNIRHYRVFNKQGLGDTDTAVATLLGPLFAMNLKSLISSTATYRGLLVTKIWPLPRTVPASSILGLGVGLIAGDPLPKQCCGLITLRTLFAGGHGRGRVYVPFPGETDNTAAGIPQVAYEAALANYAGLLINSHLVGGGGNTIDIEPVVWNRAAHTVQVIHTYSTHYRWATQRRRGDFGRSNIPPL